MTTIYSKPDVTQEDGNELLICMKSFGMDETLLDVFRSLLRLHPARRYMHNMHNALRAMVAIGKLKTYSDKAVLLEHEYAAYAELIRCCVPMNLLEVASGLLDLHWRRRLVKHNAREYFRRLDQYGDV